MAAYFFIFHSWSIGSKQVILGMAIDAISINKYIPWMIDMTVFKISHYWVFKYAFLGNYYVPTVQKIIQLFLISYLHKWFPIWVSWAFEWVSGPCWSPDGWWPSLGSWMGSVTPHYSPPPGTTLRFTAGGAATARVGVVSLPSSS